MSALNFEKEFDRPWNKEILVHKHPEENPKVENARMSG